MHFYTKLFHNILDSSIWLEDEHTRLVWITLLAMKDEQHMVESSIKRLALKARVPEEACKKAIRKFLAPDPDSTNRGHEGRRIRETERGWEILNGAYYEQLEREERRRAYNRKAQQVHRARVRGPKQAKGYGPLPGEMEHVRKFEQGVEDQYGCPIQSVEAPPQP